MQNTSADNHSEAPSTGEGQEDTHPMAINLMTLGYTNVGKTFFLGSLAKLSHMMGRGGITLKSQAYVDKGPLSELYASMGATDGATGRAPSTKGIKTAKMKLKKGMDTICSVTFHDVEGEAVEPGGNVVVGEQIRDFARKQDGFFLAIKCPKKEEGSARAMMQLAQILEFASEALSEDHNKPLTLLLTQMDRCDEVTMVEEDFTSAKSPEDAAQIANKAIEEALSQKHVEDLIEQFRRNVCNSNYSIPNRVVPCASLGIGHIDKSEVGGENFFSKLNFFTPYGTVAAFLWALYTNFALDENFKSKMFMTMHGSGQEILERIAGDFTDLHRNGEAFHSSLGPWSLDTLSDFYMFKRIGRG